MVYKKGTIVFARRTKFADNGRYDNRCGHPGMIPITADDSTGEVYYLLMTSNMIKKVAYPDQYYDLADCWETVGLNKPSLINLRTIYNSNEIGEVLAGLPPRIYKDVIRALKRYQEQFPCENYHKIKNKL